MLLQMRAQRCKKCDYFGKKKKINLSTWNSARKISRFMRKIKITTVYTRISGYKVLIFCLRNLV